jgi:Nuclear cap-binding protein subunit 3
MVYTNEFNEDLREDRKDVGLEVQRRLDTIYLYGTDNMSTDAVFQYFKDYGPSSIEWINDSSCMSIASVYCHTRAPHSNT